MNIYPKYLTANCTELCGTESNTITSRRRKVVQREERVV
jgi:hypothetical protein